MLYWFHEYRDIITRTNYEINDYKVFVFDGRAKYIQVDYDRFTDHHRNLYDCEWNYIPFTTCYPTNPEHMIGRPSCLNELIGVAEKISNIISTPRFLRIDFYVIGSKIKLGEVTFYHGSGLEVFEPYEYEIKLGELIRI